MELKESVNNISELSDVEKDALIERAGELAQQGMSNEEINEAILNEMRAEIDKDLSSLRKQLGLNKKGK